VYVLIFIRLLFFLSCVRLELHLTNNAIERLALDACDLKLDGARLARPIRRGVRARAPRRAAMHLRQARELSKRVRVPQWHEEHAVVRERADRRQDCRLLSSTLACGRREHARVLARETAGSPEARGQVPESLPLCGEVPVASGDSASSTGKFLVPAESLTRLWCSCSPQQRTSRVALRPSALLSSTRCFASSPCGHVTSRYRHRARGIRARAVICSSPHAGVVIILTRTTLRRRSSARARRCAPLLVHRSSAAALRDVLASCSGEAGTVGNLERPTVMHVLRTAASETPLRPPHSHMHRAHLSLLLAVVAPVGGRVSAGNAGDPDVPFPRRPAAARRAAHLRRSHFRAY
jgi:hypothetical protein